MPVGSSDLSDALIESEENTLRLRTAQTRRAVNPEPLPDAVLSVTVVVVTAAADRFSGNEAVSFVTERQVDGRCQVIGSPLPVDRDHPRPDLCSVAPRNAVLPWSRPQDQCSYPQAADALSTVITHGTPCPVNLETAKSRAESQGNGKHTHYHQSHRRTCQNWSPATRTRTLSGMQE